MNAEHEEAVEFAKVSKRENRVYVGNLSYDVKYRDLMEFMRGGGWGNLRLVFRYLPKGWGNGVAWSLLSECAVGQRVFF
jgi:hypothetical protein